LGVQDFIRWLLPREEVFYDLLERQGALALDAATALARFSEPGITADEVGDTVQDIEHKADKIVHEIEEALAKTFVTPIDREDIQHLSSELDDIVDLTNQAARAAMLLGVDRPTEPMKQLFRVLIEATELLREGLPNLRRHRYDALIAAARKLRQVEKEGDRIHRDALRVLFHTAEIDVRVLLREREMLETLEAAIDHCESVANTLANLAIKHG
jgi:uncharacterized protein Yka (UPF0111/DUF47 family)